MAELAPVILRWWYRRATPADSFLLGPSGYGYVYPGLMARTSQTAFAEATGNAARALGMTGYVHWDWLGDFDIGIGVFTQAIATSLLSARHLLCWVWCSSSRP